MLSTMMEPLQQELTPEEWAQMLPHEPDLPSEPTTMESSLHALQLRLLISALEWFWRDRHDFFIGDNLTIYFSYEQTKKRDFRGPDLFVVTGVDPRHRKSWVVWDEGGRLPELIIELLSDSTAAVDRGLKKDLYGQRLRVPEYFWFAPETGEFAGFRLASLQYEEIPTDERGWRWSQALSLYLGVHEGFLRYFTADGRMLPAANEAAEQETRRAAVALAQAAAATRQAEAAAQLAAQLAAKLRELGIDPNTI